MPLFHVTHSFKCLATNKPHICSHILPSTRLVTHAAQEQTQTSRLYHFEIKTTAHIGTAVSVLLSTCRPAG